MADYLGRKLQFLKIFCYTGARVALGCFGSYQSTSEWSMTALFMANIGAWGSLGFYNAFLPEIAPRRRPDLLSAKGYSWGFARLGHPSFALLGAHHGHWGPLDAMGLYRRWAVVGRMGPNHLSPHAVQVKNRTGRQSPLAGVS